MMTLSVGGATVVFLGVALAMVIWSWRASKRPTAEGTVTDVDRSSGEFPIITFTPASPPGASAGPVTFRSSFSAGSYEIGQRLTVSYDPRHPERATIMSARQARRTALFFGGVGLVTLPIALMVMLWIEPMRAARDAAVEAFLAVARRGDRGAVRAAAARGASLDEAFLLRELPASKRFVPGSSVIGFDDTSCIRGELQPRNVQIVLHLTRARGPWKVDRAGPTDSCQSELD